MTALCWALVGVSFALLVAVHVLLRRCVQRLAEAKALREDADWMLEQALRLGDRADVLLDEARALLKARTLTRGEGGER